MHSFLGTLIFSWSNDVTDVKMITDGFNCCVSNLMTLTILNMVQPNNNNSLLYTYCSLRETLNDSGDSQ